MGCRHIGSCEQMSWGRKGLCLVIQPSPFLPVSPPPSPHVSIASASLPAFPGHKSQFYSKGRSKVQITEIQEKGQNRGSKSKERSYRGCHY